MQIANTTENTLKNNLTDQFINNFIQILTLINFNKQNKF